MSASPDRIVATYRVRAAAADIEARARALATEQSVEMPLDAIDDERVLREIVGRVDAIRPDGDAFEVDLGLSPETTGSEPGQLMNMLFGNCSLQPEVELVRVAFPPGYTRAFAGPRFGIAGLRAATGAQGRPLTCTALKPQGSPVEHLAQLAYTFALSGLDLVKDDHGLADQAFSPFAERVPAVQAAIERANRESGGRTLYAPTFSGSPEALSRQAKIARDCGVGAGLVAPLLIGIPSFVQLQRELGVPVLAHPAFGGAARLAPALLFGTLFRLFGADATIFTNHGGRFSYERATCLAIARAAREPFDDIAPSLPVPAGGMTVERVAEMRGDYGDDVMLLIGGGLLSARSQLAERTRAFVRAARA